MKLEFDLEKFYIAGHWMALRYFRFLLMGNFCKAQERTSSTMYATKNNLQCFYICVFRKISEMREVTLFIPATLPFFQKNTVAGPGFEPGTFRLWA